LRGFFDDVEAVVKAKASKTKVRMSAATYVSKKTLQERDRVLNDGRTLLCFAGGNIPASTVKAETAEELAKLQAQLASIKEETKRADREVEELKQKLAEASQHRAPLEEINQRFRLEQLLQEYESLTMQLKDALLGKLPSTATIPPPSVVASRSPPAVQARKTAPAPVAAAPVLVAAKPVAAAAFDRNHVEKVLKSVLSESTGFDENLLSGEMNLEEDLGIDSIKRVEFVSTVSSRFNITVDSKTMDQLARTRLVQEVVDVFCGVFGASASAPTVMLNTALTL
jgi:acyl carrier protein